MTHWAPPRTIRPMLEGMAAFSSGLFLALLLTPVWDLYFLGLILLGVLALPLVLGEGRDRRRIRRWGILFMVGALLGTVGSLGHRYARDRGNRPPGPRVGTESTWRESDPARGFA